MADRSQMRLGRKPKVDKPKLKLAQFIKAVPAHPVASDDTAGVSYGLDGNDNYGVCVPTGYDNLRRTVTHLLTGTQQSMTQDEIFADYRSQNPGFDPATDADDNGMVIQDYLAWLVKAGRILGFASVDVSNDDELTAAEYLFLAVLWGVDLQTAQQSQTDAGLWDYKRSGQWGGHCIAVPAYEASDRQDVITWAERVGTTDAFRRHQLDEAWVVILPEHVANPGFRKGFDLQAFADAFEAITGTPFPAVVPDPGPQPEPPAPTPPGGAAADLAVALTRYLRTKNVPEYLRDAAAPWLTEQGA